MNIVQRTLGNVRVLVPEGRMTLDAEDQELGEAVRALLAEGISRIVINFEKVSYLDSSGVGELVECYTSIKKAGGELRICGMNSRALGLINLTGLCTVLAVAESESEAFAGF